MPRNGAALPHFLLGGKAPANSALYGVVISSVTGAVIGRVRLSAPDAAREMADLIAQSDGKVTISTEEASERAEAGGCVNACAAAKVRRMIRSLGTFSPTLPVCGESVKRASAPAHTSLTVCVQANRLRAEIRL